MHFLDVNEPSRGLAKWPADPPRDRPKLGGCQAWGAESENRPQRGQFLPDLQAHSPAMGQEDGEKWTAAVGLQLATPKSDSLLAMRNIDIVLIDGFPMLSATLITEPLRLANRESLAQVFAWRFLSANGDVQRSSSGFEVATDVLDDRPADAVLLLSSYHPEAGLRPEMLAWLRRRARRGELMGCIDTGALIFAAAGMPGWRLGRLFQRYLHRSPAQYYLGRRLARARNLLRNSHRQVGIIARLCGFDNHETFTRAYRRQFQIAPSADRDY